MLFGYMIGGPTLYKVKNFGSSKMFVARVFLRLRNYTFDGHISRLVQDRDNLKPLLPTKCPIDWCHCREGNVTILLAVWHFWPLAVIQTVGNGGLVMCQVPGHGSRRYPRRLRSCISTIFWQRNDSLNFDSEGELATRHDSSLFM